MKSFHTNLMNMHEWSLITMKNWKKSYESWMEVDGSDWRNEGCIGWKLDDNWTIWDTMKFFEGILYWF